jgi:hypothetical protein
VTAPDRLDLFGKVSDGATISVHMTAKWERPRTRHEISGTAGSPGTTGRDDRSALIDELGPLLTGVPDQREGDLRLG